jgi:hypothetical protein
MRAFIRGYDCRSGFFARPAERLVLNAHDRKQRVALRTPDHDLVSFGLLHERLCHGRIHTDQAVGGVEFIGPHNAVLADTSFLVFKPHPGAEKNLGRVSGIGVDDNNILKPVFEVMDPRIDLTELLLAVDVLGVLGTVPLRSSGSERRRHLGPLCVPKVLKFFGEPFLAFGRNILGPCFVGWTISAHGMNIRQRAKGIKTEGVRGKEGFYIR